MGAAAAGRALMAMRHAVSAVTLNATVPTEGPPLPLLWCTLWRYPRIVGATREPSGHVACPVLFPCATSTGGGGSDDDVLQRIRAPKWHSYLPGMFR